MITQGYIKLYRSLLDSETFQNEKLLKVFIWCLLKASHKEREQIVGRKKIKVREGQFIFGRNKASVELNMAPSTLWDYMNLLKEMETINIESNNKFSIITVEKWAIYQCKEEVSDIKSDKKQTSNKQQMDTNKNVKNVKNDIYTEIFDYWISKDIYKHKKLTSNMEKAIDKALKKHKNIEVIKEAINNYSEILKSNFYYSHIFTLEKFLTQGNGIPNFIGEGEMLINYKKDLEKSKVHDPVEESKGKVLDIKIGGE